MQKSRESILVNPSPLISVQLHHKTSSAAILSLLSAHSHLSLGIITRSITFEPGEDLCELEYSVNVSQRARLSA